MPGRPRLFEVIQRVKAVNQERLRAGIRSGAIQRDPETRKYQFSSASFDAEAIANDPTLEISYIVAPPRMRLYEEYSSRIYATYLKYVAPEDIIVYSIDEVFIDVTDYLRTYGMSVHEMTMTMVRDVLYNTGITATAGIGTNLYLAKIAMDIVAKKATPDKDGVRIAELDEMKYRELLWTHRPLTDFWRVGVGISRKLEAMHLRTMGDVARASLDPVAEDLLYKTFGVNAELLIDHAWGWEPVTMEVIKQYRPSTSSLSSGQVLHCPYDFEKGPPDRPRDDRAAGAGSGQEARGHQADGAGHRATTGRASPGSAGNGMPARVATDRYGAQDPPARPRHREHRPLHQLHARADEGRYSTCTTAWWTGNC